MDTPDPTALIAQSHRLALRLQGWALALLGLGLAGIGWLIGRTWDAMLAYGHLLSIVRVMAP